MHYTDEQISIADRIPIMDILQDQNEQYKKVGRCYYWKAHDSLRFTGPKWYRFSTREGGQAIRFCERFLQLDFPASVEYLLGNFAPYALKLKEGEGHSGTKSPSVSKTDDLKQDKTAFNEKREFRIPQKGDTNRHVFAYLTKERGISPGVVTFFMQKGSVYEAKDRCLAVFAGKDKAGNIRNANFHGVRKSDAKNKWTAEGSDLRYGFGHVGQGEKLYVFEAAIDLMSFVTIYAKDWKEHSYVSLAGVSGNALEQFLWDHPNIREVFLCLDNDKAGNEASERLYGDFKNRALFSRILPKQKDWNEVLLSTIKTEEEGNKWGISQG